MGGIANIPQAQREALGRRYRCHLVYPFEAMIATLAVGGMIPRATNLELIRRTAAAAIDHGAFEIRPVVERAI